MVPVLSEPVRRRRAEARSRRRTALAVAIVVDGRTCQEIAALAGISAHGLGMILRGAVICPRPATRQHIAEALGVPEDRIFPEFADDEIEVTR